MRRFLTVIAIAFTVLVATGCAQDTATDEIGLHYGGGVSEEKNFKGCLKPGTTNGGPNDFSGDDVYKIPYGNRDYSFGTGKGEERGPITSTAKGGAEMTNRGTVTLELTKDCKKLDELWRNLGKRYEMDTDEGWLTFLNKYVGVPVEKGLDLATQAYTPDQLTNDPGTYRELIKAVGENAPKEVNRLLGDTYFTGPNGTAEFAVSLTKPEPPARFKQEAEKAAVAQRALQTARDENARKAEEAKGIKILQGAYGRDYVTLQLIQMCRDVPDVCKGWLVPPGGSLGTGSNLQIPARK